MGTVFDGIDAEIREFIEAQPMFFVGTAPSGPDGLVNISPKGYRDSFAVLDEHTVAYLDLFGSGAETIAHLRENGRIVLMFCSFTRNSRILRLHGRGRVLRPDGAAFRELAPRFNLQHPGLRSIIRVNVTRVADSCGYSVPYMELAGERPVLDKVHGMRTPEQWAERVAGNNARSLDGLPALEPDHPLPTSIPRDTQTQTPADAIG
jgi:pyridoxamine 5'-phosphate oxidase-like protein